MNFYRADESLRDLLALYLATICAPTSSRISIVWVNSQARNSMRARRWRTGIRPCCTSATVLGVMCNGSNTIRRIAASKRSRTANSASTR